MQPGVNRQLQTLLTLGAVGSMTDAELLARFVAGADRAEVAFEAIVDRHGPLVLRVARTILGDEASSLDAFQATFLILAQKARTLCVNDSLAPWLASVARRVALGSRKAQARRARHEQRAARSEVSTDGSANVDPWSETVRAVVAEVDRLPEPYRSAVVACHLDGLTQQAAANHLGWPIGTLQSRLDRGRRKLRDRLARQGLAPTSLAILPPTGLITPLPQALATTTARIAALWVTRSTSSTLIAPGVLAILQPTTKGIIMANLKVGTLVLGAAIAAAGSGWALGIGSSDKTGDGPAPSASPVVATDLAKPTESSQTIIAPAKVAGSTNVALIVEDLDNHGVKPSAPAVLLSAAGHTTLATVRDPSAKQETTGPKSSDPEAVPPPTEGPDLPTLLCFTASWRDPDLRILPKLTKLVEKGYPVRVLDMDGAPDLSKRYKVNSVPSYVLIDGLGVEIARTTGLMPTNKLAEFYNQYRPKAVAETTQITEEPLLTIPPYLPRPWETVVRIKIHLSSKESGFGSGTVIASTPSGSLILTTASIFRDHQGNFPSHDQFDYPISIDLFDNRLPATGPARLASAERDLVGELVAIHFDRNYALVQIRPGRILPAAPIPSEEWTATKGVNLISLGCSHGNDATAWDTQVLDPKVKMTSESRTFFAVKCTNPPAQGRSGGGLFTRTGYLVGIATFTDPVEKVGLYTEARDFRDLNSCIKRVGNTVHFDLASLKKIAGIQLMSSPPLVSNDPNSMSPSEPISDRPVSNQEQRLHDLEQKLDRVLQSLENSRGELTPFRLNGGLGP